MLAAVMPSVRGTRTRQQAPCLQFVVPDFEAQYLSVAASDVKRKSPTFQVGGFTWCGSLPCNRNHHCSCLPLSSILRTFSVCG